jgi:hypothetical protein
MNDCVIITHQSINDCAIIFQIRSYSRLSAVMAPPADVRVGVKHAKGSFVCEFEA